MSTLVELAGFACWVAAAFVWQSVPFQSVTGLLALGACLLLVGLAVDDVAATVAVRRVTRPVVARFRAMRASRAVKREAAAGVAGQ